MTSSPTKADGRAVALLVSFIAAVTGSRLQAGELDCIPPEPTVVEDPSLGVAVDCFSTRLLVSEDPPRALDLVDPSLGLTDGGLLGRGLPCCWFSDEK